MVKPDGVRRGLVGEVLGRIERKGYRITRLEMRAVDVDLSRQHYAEHTEKPFYGELEEFITSGPVVAMVVEGPGVVETVRAMMGPTNPLSAPAGTLRGDFGTVITENIVHGSDSPESAEREIEIWFGRTG